MDIVMLGFRIFTIFIGLLVGFISYRIFVLSKGSVNSWAYIAFSGFALAGWAITQALFDGNMLLINISSIIGYTAIALSFPIGLVKLNAVFGIKLNKFFSTKIMLTIYGLLLALLLALNFLLIPIENITSKLAAIALFLMGVMSLYASYPSYKIWKQTGRWFWMFLFTFTVLVGMGLVIETYFGGTCEVDQEVSEVCEEFSKHYSGIIPAPAVSEYVDLTPLYYIFHLMLLIGLIFGVAGLYGIRRQFE